MGPCFYVLCVSVLCCVVEEGRLFSFSWLHASFFSGQIRLLYISVYLEGDENSAVQSLQLGSNHIQALTGSCLVSLAIPSPGEYSGGYYIKNLCNSHHKVCIPQRSQSSYSNINPVVKYK